MFEFWCEYDINPLIIFDEKGHIKYCNQEAEIFLSYINHKEVFQFVINNASNQPGIRTEFKKIKFQEFEFNGFSIGYQNEKEIGIRLFINTSSHSIDFSSLEEIDLAMLINFAIEYLKLKKNIEVKTYFDPSIPPLLVNKKALLDLLLEIIDNKAIISTKINIGEYIKIQNKKYQIVEINIKSSPKNITSTHFEIIQKDDSYTIKIPLIKDINENNNS